MRFCFWFVVYNLLPARGEWVKLPKVNPSSKTDKKLYRAPVEDNGNKGIISLDINMEKILMEVHKTLAAEGRSNINRKENFLKKLKNQLLYEIWGESNNIWSRTGIEARTHGGHGMAFPSLEGALMTISFLTFAVFLIKIVKQCIQGLQSANGNVIGIEVPGSMVAPAKVIKHKRSIFELSGLKPFHCSKLPQFYSSKVCTPDLQ